MAEQFNAQLVNYAAVRGHSFVPFVVKYSFAKYIGDIKGKSIIDFGCGDGDYTRLFKQWGASEVVGVDISEKMITGCIKHEQLDALGIKYLIKDIRDISIIEEFDVGVASLVLQYSETREHLFAMCANIYKNLKPGGRIFCISSNPNYKGITDYSDYSIQILHSPVLRDSDIITLNAFQNTTKLSLMYYYYSKETYEKTLLSVGFKNIRWTNLSISPEGIKKFGAEFWKAFLEDPHIIIITADK